MLSPASTTIPSHMLYADEIFIFCRGDKESPLVLNIPHNYGLASGQLVDFEKNQLLCWKQNISLRIATL